MAIQIADRITEDNPYSGQSTLHRDTYGTIKPVAAREDAFKIVSRADGNWDIECKGYIYVDLSKRTGGKRFLRRDNIKVENLATRDVEGNIWNLVYKQWKKSFDSTSDI